MNIIRKVLINASEILGFNQRDLSEIIGFSELMFSCTINNRATVDPNSKEWELALLFLRMYRSLDSLFGGYEDQCKLWMQTYNKHLAGMPKELIKKVEGLVVITQYLDAMRGLA